VHDCPADAQTDAQVAVVADGVMQSANPTIWHD